MPVNQVLIIEGGLHVDDRGYIKFNNEFDMKDVRRFYRISNKDTDFKRGWRAHRIEHRWFCVLSGTFEIKVIKIDDWENPDSLLPVQIFTLTESSSVLSVPKGHATCIQALEATSEILVFADSVIVDAGKDDYLFPVDYFKN